jgi:hypothetical protein
MATIYDIPMPIMADVVQYWANAEAKLPHRNSNSYAMTLYKAQCVSKGFIEALKWLLAHHKVHENIFVKVLKAKYMIDCGTLTFDIVLFDDRCPDIGRDFVQNWISKNAKDIYRALRSNFDGFERPFTILSDLDRLTRYIIKWNDTHLLHIFQTSTISYGSFSVCLWSLFMALKCQVEGKVAIAEALIGEKPSIRVIIRKILTSATHIFQYSKVCTIDRIILIYIDKAAASEVVDWLIEAEFDTNSVQSVVRSLNLDNIRAEMKTRGLWPKKVKSNEFDNIFREY